MSIDMGSRQIPMENNQATSTEPISNPLGSHQLSISTKRMTQMSPTIGSPASQQIPGSKRMTPTTPNLGSPAPQQASATKRMTQMLSMPKNTGTQQNRKVTHVETNNSGPQHSLTSGKRSAPMEPSPKGQSESSESVRAKLRESLTEALALVYKPQNQAAETTSEDASGKMLKPANENDVPSSSTEITPENSSKEKETAQKTNGSLNSSREVFANDLKVDSATNSMSDKQDFQFNYVLPDEDTPFSEFFAKDELLQGNGLCWVTDVEVSEEIPSAKKPKLVHEGDYSVENSQPSPQELASSIEAELFKLYGGVNKKYKEKARSLLFNLKDRNNPELREKVMSGVITPERLCSMTAEELASKELSEWRIAKAEEYAQMVVLPDSNVDVRRLVKKTHKGEFQVVEFEQDDGVTMEVAVSAPKAIEEATSSKPHEALSDEGADELMQGLMADDELKDAEFLPPIISLDEFMESLDSEPPFENLPTNSEPTAANTTPDDKKDNSPDSDLKSESSNSPKKRVKLELKYTKLEDDLIEEPETTTTATIPDKSTPSQEHVWEGLLQLNVSSMVTVTGNFKSGERTSAKEWPNFLDVKGRVRMDAFEKFLQELPKSRSRAIMIVHFQWKEGTPESGRIHLTEVVESYVADDRVGFAEPAPGVELYLCPPHTKITEMLGKNLSKDHIETLNALTEGLIGIVVWRKVHVTTNPRKLHHSTSLKREKTHVSKQASVDEDDIPPGFGPPGFGPPRDEDDLPEFDFSRNSNSSTQPPAQPRQVEQMRNLIHRYGQNARGAKNGDVDDDDDDDIPEWQPQTQQVQLPPPPPPPPVTAVQLPPPPPLPPQMVQIINQLPPPQLQPPPLYPPMQPFVPHHHQPMPLLQHLQPMNNPAWPPQQGWRPQYVVGSGGGLPPPPPPVGMMVTNYGGQVYPVPPGYVVGPPQNGVEWRMDVNNSRGF